MAPQKLLSLTADIVAAHVANNNVPINDVATLVRRVHDSLSQLEAAPATSQEKAPVVSVRASVKPDYLVCMECGKKQKMLRRHLQTAHNMSPEQYRRDYGLPDHYPMTAPNYSEQRSGMAKRIGLGRRGAPKEDSDAAAQKVQAASPFIGSTRKSKSTTE